MTNDVLLMQLLDVTRVRLRVSVEAAEGIGLCVEIDDLYHGINAFHSCLLK